ncbi:MAG: AAA family ATPase, partial [Lentisphaeria bacterium]|nr:AAA family ATPase [Lentisphaeria bacterium]
MARLEILEGPDAGRPYELDKSAGRLVIGRGDECNIRINQGSISRQHAALEFTGGAWVIEDLKSQNGVFIADKPVKREKLTEPIQIRFGTIMTSFDPEAGDLRRAITSSGGEDEGYDTGVADGREDTVVELGDEIAPLGGKDPMSEEAIQEIRDLGNVYQRIEEEFGKVIVGQRAVLEELLVAIAAGGHCLMIGLPGLAKTLMISTLGQILRLKFKRIQFTPDLMPSDIIGTDVL